MAVLQLPSARYIRAGSQGWLRRTQLTALALSAQNVRRDFIVSCYVFFPKGDYKRIQMLLVDDESGNTEVTANIIRVGVDRATDLIPNLARKKSERMQPRAQREGQRIQWPFYPWRRDHIFTLVYSSVYIYIANVVDKYRI